MADYHNERLDDELELLKCVCLDDVVINFKDNERSNGVDYIYMIIYPATAGNMAEQFVRVDICLTLPDEYPDARPVFKLKNPRGLSEDELERLESSINKLIQEEDGNPVLVQIYNLVRETLSNSNVPHGYCSICLTDFFDESMQFIKTECYHYFHKTCIYLYKHHWLTNLKEEEMQKLPVYQQAEKNELSCPECRKPVNLPADEISIARDEEPFLFKPSEALKQQQKEWQNLYEKQKCQGGIIDIEAEKQKYRLPPPINSDADDTNSAEFLIEVHSTNVPDSSAMERSTPTEGHSEAKNNELKNNGSRLLYHHRRGHHHRHKHNHHHPSRHYHGSYGKVRSAQTAHLTDAGKVQTVNDNLSVSNTESLQKGCSDNLQPVASNIALQKVSTNSTVDNSNSRTPSGNNSGETRETEDLTLKTNNLSMEKSAAVNNTSCEASGSHRHPRGRGREFHHFTRRSYRPNRQTDHVGRDNTDRKEKEMARPKKPNSKSHRGQTRQSLSSQHKPILGREDNSDKSKTDKSPTFRKPDV